MEILQEEALVSEDTTDPVMRQYVTSCDGISDTWEAYGCCSDRDSSVKCEDLDAEGLSTYDKEVVSSRVRFQDDKVNRYRFTAMGATWANDNVPSILATDSTILTRRHLLALLKVLPKDVVDFYIGLENGYYVGLN